MTSHETEISGPCLQVASTDGAELDEASTLRPIVYRACCGAGEHCTPGYQHTFAEACR
jgi:hypothetical protein